MATSRILLLMFTCALFSCSRAYGPTGDPKAVSQSASATVQGKSSTLPATGRKVIRSVELTMEVASPTVAEAAVIKAVERLGGYVESSERTLSAQEGERGETRAHLTLRTPSAKLGELLRELKRLSAGAENETIRSEDVSAEYIDLEARVSNQRRLEAQMVTLLGSTTTLESALKLHQELARVRTEIDQTEGRRHFLATEVDLTKVSLTLSPLAPAVSISLAEVGVSLRHAVSDALQVAGGVVTGCIRVAGIAFPLMVLLGLPGLLVWRVIRRLRSKAVAVLGA